SWWNWCKSLSESAGQSKGRSRPPRSERKVGEAGGWRADQGRHVAFRMLVLRHELMGGAELVEAEGLGQARIDPPVHHQLVESGRLLVVGEVRTLKSLLAHPQVPEVG